MGFAAAIGATVSTMIIAAIGAWYGRWVDGLIQRVTEVNLILPVLPVLIMVGTLYSRSLPVIMGLFVLLNVFSGSIKTIRLLLVLADQGIALHRGSSVLQRQQHAHRVPVT